MTPDVLRNIATRPFEMEFSIGDVPATYIGTQLPLDGSVGISVSPKGIAATLRNSDDWLHRSLRMVPKGTPTQIPDLFRMPAAGFIVRDVGYGCILPNGDGWSAKRSAYCGMTQDIDDTYRFDVGELRVEGSSRGEAAAGFRQIYLRSSLAADATIRGGKVLIRSLSATPANVDSELVAVTSDWRPEPDVLEALRLALSFVTGNTVRHIAEEAYDEAGILIETVHRHGSTPDDKRRAPFHRYYGPLASDGISVIANGMYRLKQGGFPIGVMLQHAHEAAHRAHDIEAQHLVLAIHTAIEAWNRLVGFDAWIDDRLWNRYQRNLRKAGIPPEVYEDLGTEMRENIRSAFAHANRTTTAWRESSFFKALKIDISDSDNTRSLKLRDELLHNGYFVKRWSELAEDEQQQRLDDIKRLNRLVILVVLKLTSYNCTYMNPVTLQPELVTPIELPPFVKV